VQALQARIDSELIRLDWSDSKFATKTRSILISSLRRSMNRTSNATHVVGRNRNSESATMTTHSIQQRIFYYSHLLRFISIHDIDGNSKMICTADRMKHVLYVSRELNIYYMPENTKIWAEIRSSLNIWSWIERVCLNDKNSESAAMTQNDTKWSLDWVRHSKWVCYNDKSIVDLLTELVTWTEQALLHACSRHEKNKLYDVVDLNQKWVCFNDIWQEEIDLKRLMKWAWNAQWNELETLYVKKRAWNTLDQEEIDLKHLMKWAWNAQWNELETLDEMSLKRLNRTITKWTRKKEADWSNEIIAWLKKREIMLRACSVFYWNVCSLSEPRFYRV